MTAMQFEPDYKKKCEACGQKPSVTTVNDTGAVIDNWNLCGPCMFGTAAALDPDWWNNYDD